MSSATDHKTIAAELKEVPGFQFIDHFAISVPQGQLDGQVAAYELLGFNEIHREEVHGKDMVREALLQIGDGPNLIQLLEPLSPESPVQKLIEKGAKKAFDYMKDNGFTIIDAAPRPGSRGTTVFFVHPKSRAENAFGFLIEIVEDPN